MKDKNILLINPRALKWKQHKVRRKAVPLGLPLGLGFLASFLEEKGVRAVLYDEQIEPLADDGFIRIIKKEDVKFVCG